MQTCAKCGKLYAEKFSACPHCGGAKGALGCLALVVIAGVAIWAIAGNNASKRNGVAKWESISGIQQGVFLTMEIDANSIERISDGAAATVIIKLPPTDELRRTTYICRAPQTGLPGAVIFDDKVADLPAGSTGDAIMRRVCYGPISGGH
jgi:RNA polymerase subunit RPABC4/transcription elongation factor Spt4